MWSPDFVHQLGRRHDGQIDLAANRGGENHIPLVADETRVRIVFFLIGCRVGRDVLNHYWSLSWSDAIGMIASSH
jgi:hypothetical protein